VFLLEGQPGLAYVPQARSYIFENKFSRVGFLAACRMAYLTRIHPKGCPRIKPVKSPIKIPTIKVGTFIGGPAGT
jgi:hypothetical protein